MIHQLQKQLLKYQDCRNNKAIIKLLNTNTSHLYGIMWTGMLNPKPQTRKYDYCLSRTYRDSREGKQKPQKSSYIFTETT